MASLESELTNLKEEYVKELTLKEKHQTELLNCQEALEASEKERATLHGQVEDLRRALKDKEQEMSDKLREQEQKMFDQEFQLCKQEVSTSLYESCSHMYLLMYCMRAVPICISLCQSTLLHVE